MTKVATELLGNVYTDLYGLDVVSLRITEIYGPGNKMPQFLKEIIGPALRGEPYRLEKGGDHRFQFVRVEDVARAAILAADVEELGQRVYNITGGSQITLAAAANIVREAVPGADIEIGPGYTHLDQSRPIRHLRRRARSRLHARVAGRARHRRLRRVAAQPPLLGGTCWRRTLTFREPDSWPT